MITESRAWLACAIDGEGGIYVRDRSSQNKLIAICVYNTNREFAEKAKGLMNGHISPQKQTGIGKKMRYRASVYDQEKIKIILKEIFPYLIIKQDIAKEVIEYLESHEISSPRKWKNLSLETQEKIKARLRKGCKEYFNKQRGGAKP